MKMIVDRIEGQFAVCELETKKMMDIPLSDLPNGTKEGMELEEMDGRYTILDNSDAKKRIQEKMNRLYKK